MLHSHSERLAPGAEVQEDMKAKTEGSGYWYFGPPQPARKRLEEMAIPRIVVLRGLLGPYVALNDDTSNSSPTCPVLGSQDQALEDHVDPLVAFPHHHEMVERRSG